MNAAVAALGGTSSYPGVVGYYKPEFQRGINEVENAESLRGRISAYVAWAKERPSEAFFAFVVIALIFAIGLWIGIRCF